MLRATVREHRLADVDQRLGVLRPVARRELADHRAQLPDRHRAEPGRVGHGRRGTRHAVALLQLGLWTREPMRVDRVGEPRVSARLDALSWAPAAATRAPGPRRRHRLVDVVLVELVEVGVVSLRVRVTAHRNRSSRPCADRYA